MKKMTGMTLIEVVSVIAILGVLFLIAQGAWTAVVRGQTVKLAATEVFSALVTARTEALKRNSCVEVVPTAEGRWDQGWRVELPLSGGVPACGGGERRVLRTFASQDDVEVAGPAGAIVFTGAGRLSTLGESGDAGQCSNSCTPGCTVSDTPPSFRLQRSDSEVLRCVSVRSSGAPEVRKG